MLSSTSSAESNCQFQCDQSFQFPLSSSAFGANVQQQFKIISPPPMPPIVVAATSSCPVCGESSNGTFFGVPTCRACGSFFRRSMLEKRKYLCRRENNCAIINKDGMRNSCRACRLKRCFEVGMDFSQKHPKIPSQAPKLPLDTAKDGSPEAIISDQQQQQLPTCWSISQAQLAPVTEEIAFRNNLLTMSSNYPNSTKFLQYFRNFENGQRALVNVLEGTRKIILDNQQLHMIKHDEQTKIERGSITLLLEHLREQFPQFNEQSAEVKISIVKSYSFQCTILRICASTLKFFPDQSDPIKHLVINGCCLVAIDELDYFFSSHESANEERKKYGLVCIDSFGMLISRLRPLEVSELELSALNGLQLWNCVERFVPLRDDQKARRDVFFVELHAMVAQRNGTNVAEIAIRFGSLLKLLLDAANLAMELLETFALADIFFPSVHSFSCTNDVIYALIVNSELNNRKKRGGAQ